MSTPSRKPFSWKRAQASDHRPVLRVSTRQHRWDVRLVGMTSRSRFVVTHPTTPESRLVFMKEGEPVEVANFDGAVLCAFASQVLKVTLGEAPTLELSLPPVEQRRREVVRRSRRASVTLPCSVRYGEGEHALRAGFVCDLSQDGAQVAIEHPLPEGTREVDLSMRVSVLGEPVTLPVRAEVRSQQPDPRPEMPATLLGLRFVSVERPMQLALGHFVAERLLADGDDVFGAIR